MNYDLIVSGAGPAGSVTAAAVAQAGYRVLVLEKNSSCRSPCAGYIGSTINIELPRCCTIQSKIRKMRTYFPDLSFHDFQLNGFVVDRSSFDMALAMKAEESGAEIRLQSPLIDLIPDGVRFRGGEAFGMIIVGADGVFSGVASLLGAKRQRAAFCAQYHMRGIEPLSEPGTCEIFFDADYAPGGYVWIYPTGHNSAKVGLGITDAGCRSPHKYLDAFIDESAVAERLRGERTEYMAGALPIGGLREKLCYGNVLLVGDSSGMADPVTGAGINNAMLAGEIAGKTIINALENDDTALFGQYETTTRRLLGRPLKRSLAKREKLDHYCASNELLQQHLPEVWVTFEEYWA
ncbi:MAG: Digeranylgeranylglycerophospholipid reductase [Candidatus Methanogasteraceae archaeon]|nr:MAG: Digeranylgeranylglycerophospholipid reductase [ANME-2 cluster archaeon]